MMFVEFLAAALVLAATYVFYDIIHKNSYWRRKGVPGPFQYPLSGRFSELTKIGPGEFDTKWTRKFGRIFGGFEGPKPVIIIADSELLKLVMVKDFSHFVNRRIFKRGNKSVLNLALTKLTDQHWKDVRGVVAPTFTSGKLRMMTSLLRECCATLLDNMTDLAKNGTEFEAKKLYLSATFDVITSTFFATKVDLQKDPNNTFMHHIKNAFGTKMSFVVYIAFYFPNILPWAEKLGLQSSNKASTDFFIDRIKEIIKLRLESNDESRKDFLQLMLNSVKGTASNQHVLKAALENETLTDVLSTDLTPQTLDKPGSYKLSIEILLDPRVRCRANNRPELVAQSVIFLMAGYETTASTLAFLTYSLAIHSNIQERLHKEIKQVLGSSEEVTYDHLAEMNYLDCCVNETLRLYPPAMRTERECGTTWRHDGLTIEKGDVVVIPIYAMHHDAEYWPNPEKYDPDRFSAENKQNIKPYAFQAFGQGPRNCVGMRFAYFDIKMMIVSVLRKFRFVPCSRTEVPLTMEKIGLLRAENGIWIKLEAL